jgi:cysteinyl-tRNA synthetase
LYLFNTKTSQKEKFEPLGEKVRIYVCGPTVYDHAHLGHARSAISFDLLIRTLRAVGFDTLFARNITDIDDKIIKKMADTGKSQKEITDHYQASYKKDLAELNCLAPDLEPKATDNIEAMVEMVEKLLNSGCAYKITNGDIYFDTTKDDKYLSLSGRVSDDLQSRIESGGEKKDQKDFVLWKAYADGDSVYFDATIGKGRPGWHLECSAMINAHLATAGEFQIDIHGGGSDLIFPHHENECAQTRCAYGQELAEVWMHNGFVTINDEKMSKSLGNGFVLNEAIEAFGGEYVRNYLIQTHYRQNFNFSHEDLNVSKKRLDKLYRLKKRVCDAAIGEVDEGIKKRLLDALTNDLNISEGFAVLEDFISSSNERLDSEPKNKELKSSAIATIGFVSQLFGLGYKEPHEHFQQGFDETQKQEINELITKRAEAKKEKNFALADEMRAKLGALGVAIMDTATGTVWERAQA